MILSNHAASYMKALIQLEVEEKIQNFNSPGKRIEQKECDLFTVHGYITHKMLDTVDTEFSYFQSLQSYEYTQRSALPIFDFKVALPLLAVLKSSIFSVLFEHLLNLLRS